MEIKNLKNLSISNLILIIVNDKYSDILRKCAEVELRKRVKHLGIQFDDLVHFDDKVIQERGLDIDNYLLSPSVNLQQLMETYFKYCYRKQFEKNGLLFSEKHLCNDNDIGSPFFSNLCKKEIARLNKRIVGRTYIESHDDLVARDVLQLRGKVIKQDNIEFLRDDPVELLFYNDALYQLDDGITLEPYMNLSDEERYKYLSTHLGRIKLAVADVLSDTILDPDIIQYLYGLHFVLKDSRKLNYQKRLLMNQLRRGYEVDYGSEEIKKVLK